MSMNRKDQRRQEAEVRKAERAKRTDQQQLDHLITIGHGHCKEAERLRERIK